METTITRIARTRQGRFALFCGDEFLFSVDDETFFGWHLAEGSTLSAAELEELRARSDTKKAIAKALEYLSLRDHAAGELYDKLRKKFDPASCRAAVERMRELGLTDDYAFALGRARYLLAQRKSRRAVEHTLAEKGVDKETICRVMEEVYTEAEEEGKDPEMEALRGLIEKNYARRLAQGRTDQVAAALCRRGFAPAAVRAALREYTPSTEENFEL